MPGERVLALMHFTMHWNKADIVLSHSMDLIPSQLDLGVIFTMDLHNTKKRKDIEHTA